MKINDAKIWLVDDDDEFCNYMILKMRPQGVSLIRFQQSYAASAQVITTAKEVFDTLLSAAR